MISELLFMIFEFVLAFSYAVFLRFCAFFSVFTTGLVYVDKV